MAIAASRRARRCTARFEADPAAVKRNRTLRRSDSSGCASSNPRSRRPAIILATVLASEKGLAKESTRVAAYWKRGETAHHQNLAD